MLHIIESDGLKTGGAALVLQEISDIGRQQIEGGWYLSPLPLRLRKALSRKPLLENLNVTHGAMLYLVSQRSTCF